MKWMRRISARFSVVNELFYFLWQQKLWWLIPMMLVLILFGFIMIFAQSSPMAPFIYTLF